MARQAPRADHSRNEQPKLFALFAYGFRPFFLGAAAQAVAAIVIWLLALETPGVDFHGLEPMQWHTHEMLFGFVGAAAAGFVLTAVPNWTTRRGYFGPPLMFIFALWLAARIAVNPFLALPLWAPFLLNVAFVPSLIGLILPSLIRSGNRKNYVIAGMLSLYGLADLLCWLEVMGWTRNTWDRGVALGFDLMLLLVTVIGGRLVPSFTSSSLRRRGADIALPVNTGLDRVTILLTALLLLAHQLTENDLIVAALAGAAAIAHAWRLLRWQGWRTLGDPLLWILHAAYVWIPVALGVQAIFFLTGSPYASAWRHGYSVGVFACMILAIMSRVALGHTGRPAVAPKAMVFGYVALMAAGVCRILAPVFSGNYQAMIDTAGALWISAFAIYLIVYAPILIRPRIDGRPG